MMALMLAPAYKGFGEYDGFGQTGSLIGGEFYTCPLVQCSDSSHTTTTACSVVCLLPATFRSHCYFHAPLFSPCSPFPPAVIMAIVIGTACYFRVSKFRAQNLKNFNEAIAKKKAADAKVAAGNYGDEERGGSSSGGRANLSTPLLD